VEFAQWIEHLREGVSPVLVSHPCFCLWLPVASPMRRPPHQRRLRRSMRSTSILSGKPIWAHPSRWIPMTATLKADRGAAFDRDYVNGQVEYQRGNAALFRQEIENGSDPDLKQFAIQTLPKIEDHLQRILKLAGASGGHSASN
jgi:hypothetical protein